MNFFVSLAFLYPCSHCAKDMQIFIKEHPPIVDSRESLSLWVCEMHNDVNKRLGLKAYECNFKALDERWRTGNKVYL